MEITKEFIAELDRKNFTPTHIALEIVNTLIYGAIEEAEIPVNNTFNLTLTPKIKTLLKDWLELWGQNVDGSYNIIGNFINIKTDNINSITPA